MDSDAIRKLLDEATPGPWTGHNMVHADNGRPMTPEEIGEYVCNSVKIGAVDRFLFVGGKHDDGGDCDVCHTGNGPRGPANTALIAAAPDLAAEVLRLLDRLIAEEEAKIRLAYIAAEEIGKLKDLLTEALPWVEAQLDDPANKHGTVRVIASRIRAALKAKLEGAP